MKRAALEVHAGRERAGRLTRSAVHDLEFLFGYSNEARARSAVSLTMPVVPDQYDSSNTVHPVFEMSLPEGALRERLTRDFGKAIPAFDDLDLLGIVGASQIGRLRYASPGDALPEVPAQSVRALLAYKGADDLMESLLERYARVSGVSGMQPKVLVRDADTLDRITHRDTTHIVKSFDPRVYPELAANEFFCMRAAELSGLPVPRIRLATNRRALVVERFDLGHDGDYLGFEDFCVLNALRSSGRYDSSYESIGRRITQFVSPERTPQALEQFFVMVALSCALGNGDAHLKNFGVLYADPESEVWFAPAFDVVCTRAYQPRDSLALALAGSKAFPNRSTLIKFARHACRLQERRARGAIDRVLEAVSSTRQEIQRFARGHPDFRPAAMVLSRLLAEQSDALR